jgi:hypothetical protein
MKPLPAIAVLTVILSLSPAVQAFEHKQTGFGVDLPAEFIVDPDIDQMDDYDILVGINPASGEPAPADSNPHVCQAGFQGSTANQGLRQKQINALARDDLWIDTIVQSFEPLMKILAYEGFTQSGIAGLQLMTTPRMGPNAENTWLVFNIMETPKGRTMLVCTATRDGIWPALPVFQRIRQGIIPPR